MTLWIDLGFHPQACLTQRYMCGAAGGAVTLWLKLFECGGGGAIINTRPRNLQPRRGFFSGAGFLFSCRRFKISRIMQ